MTCACASALLQILSVSTSSGQFSCYLAALPSVFAAYGTRVANLTSIGELTVQDVAARCSTVVQVACEPAICSLGPAHLAAGMNNQVGRISWGVAWDQ